jgi:hypothetical protein
LRRISVRESVKAPGWASLITLLSDTAYHSFIGEVEARPNRGVGHDKLLPSPLVHGRTRLAIDPAQVYRDFPENGWAASLAESPALVRPLNDLNSRLWHPESPRPAHYFRWRREEGSEPLLFRRGALLFHSRAGPEQF